MNFEDQFASYLTDPSSHFESDMTRIGFIQEHDNTNSNIEAASPIKVMSNHHLPPPILGLNNRSKMNSNNSSGNNSSSDSSDKLSRLGVGHYTIAGRTQQNSRQFSKYYYKQVGTFLTQYKIRENYKFLQMISVPPLDPAVPKPEGGVSVPACGEPLVVAPSFPQSIEAAIHKFANASSKATCISVVDQYGKVTGSLTYG